MRNSIYQPIIIHNYFLKLKLYSNFSMTTIKHFFTIVLTSLSLGYRGKIVNFDKYSTCHRTTIAHFLNHGVWKDDLLEDIIQTTVLRLIFEEARRTNSPIFCIIDDTVSSKTKPSSRAIHPIEDAYFHYSHLKRKQDYGHQAVAIMFNCNNLTLNYAILLYDKSRTKIQMVMEIAKGLPQMPTISYMLCDCWYTCPKIIHAFEEKGFYVIAAVKTNRKIYPCGIEQGISEFAQFMEKTDSDVHSVTVNIREYYVYRYEGSLNGIENAVVLLSYPENAFHEPKALRAFLCTNVSLDIEEILRIYAERWPIEVFFRQCKNTLALDQYQIRSSQGVRRFWLLMSLTHLFCCIGTGEHQSFGKGYTKLQKSIQEEQIYYIYNCGKHNVPIDDIFKVVA